jgi:hypothetical protein
LVIPVTFILANCSTFGGTFDGQPLIRSVILPPPEAHEIPLQEPALEVPAPPQPEAPQIASLPVKPRVPVSRTQPMPRTAMPPKEAAPEPEPVAPADLVGFDFPAVQQVLGHPSSVQNSALSVVWTYWQTECTVQLYFYPDIQTKIFHLLKYDLKNGTGERLNDWNSCMRQIVAMRTDEPASP